MYYGQMRGDYYRGDYYQGDPGFFSFLGGLAKKAVSFIPGVGPAVSTALELIPKGGARVSKTGAMTAIKKVGPIVTAIGKSKGGKLALGAGALGAAALIGRATRGAGGATGRRHRRMNVCNVRALRRSIRRTQGFAKLAMRTIHLVHPKKHARFGGFKKRARKRTV